MLQRSTYEPKTYFFFFFPPKIYFKEIGKLANRVSTVWKKPVTLKQGWSLLELLEARSQLYSRSESKQPAPRNCGTALSAPARWCQLLTVCTQPPQVVFCAPGQTAQPQSQHSTSGSISSLPYSSREVQFISALQGLRPATQEQFLPFLNPSAFPCPTSRKM